MKQNKGFSDYLKHMWVTNNDKTRTSNRWEDELIMKHFHYENKPIQIYWKFHLVKARRV